MSGPRGKRGFFYETWQDAGAEWERVQVTAEECPRIRRSFLEEERRTMGEGVPVRVQRHGDRDVRPRPAGSRDASTAGWLDLGQAHDYTALAVIEAADTK